MFADLTSYDGASFYLREKKFSFLRYDCRGQGKSPKPDSVYNLELHVFDLKNLLDQLNLKNIILIGLSNGGRVVFEFARLYPEYVKAIVACDTFEAPTPLLRQKLMSWLSAHETGGSALRFDVATPWIWGEEVFREKGDLILSYRNKAENTPDYVAKNLILGAIDPEIDISTITAPVLLIVGEEDLLTPVFLMQKTLAKLKNGKLIIVEGGHASMIERPTIMDKTIIPWIQSL